MPADIERLRRRRALGHGRYVLRYGIVGCGLCMGAPITVAALSSGRPLVEVLVLAFVLLGGGILIGEGMWRYVCTATRPSDSWTTEPPAPRQR